MTQSTFNLKMYALIMNNETRMVLVFANRNKELMENFVLEAPLSISSNIFNDGRFLMIEGFSVEARQEAKIKFEKN